MKTIGVDFASQPAGTAAVILDWEDGGGPTTITGICEGLTDDAVVGLLGESSASRVGVDIPFGWPGAFVDHVSAWSRGERWPPGAAIAELRYRLTDRHVIAETNVYPLSVSSDRIAIPAFRFAHLLTLIAEAGGDERRVGGRIVEVYPTAALHRWQIPSKGHKGKNPAAQARRSEILATLVADAGLDVGVGDAGRLIASDHCLDALVCSLAARAAATGQTDEPLDEHLDTIRVEGGIELPRTGSLRTLGSPPGQAS